MLGKEGQIAASLLLEWNRMVVFQGKLISNYSTQLYNLTILPHSCTYIFT